MNKEDLEVLKPYLETECGYRELKFIEGRGICGLLPFMFTTAIVYGIGKSTYEGRFCYPNDKAVLAVAIFSVWDGKEDPDGPWIKHKGSHEYRNPKLEV